MSCPPISEGCPYTYIGTVFFGIGLGFLVLRISFWLLSFGVLGDLQLGDLFWVSEFFE